MGCRLTIVYISYSTIPSRSANSIHVMKMCQAFSANGHKVILITPKKRNLTKSHIQDIFSFYGVQNCFDILFLPWQKLSGQRHIYGLHAYIKARKYNPDIVYSRNISGCFFAAKMGLPIIFESHSPIAKSGVIPERMFRNLLNNFQLNKLVVITNILKEYYENHYSQTVGKIHVAPDGADITDKNIQPINLPGKKDNLKVGYVGHLYKGRGIDLIVKVSQKCPWADFHVVGGENKDIIYWKNLTRGLNNIFFHGFVSPSNADILRISFDILLCPYQEQLATAAGVNSVNWMSPLKVFEYMASGKPIISSSLPVLCEILEHDRNALLCPPDDIDSWIESIKILRDSSSLRKRLGKEAKKDLRCKYTWKARSMSIIDNFC